MLSFILPVLLKSPRCPPHGRLVGPQALRGIQQSQGGATTLHAVLCHCLRPMETEWNWEGGDEN